MHQVLTELKGLNACRRRRIRRFPETASPSMEAEEAAGAEAFASKTPSESVSEELSLYRQS